MSMIPIQQSLAAWGGGHDGDVRDAEKTAYLHRTRHYLHAFWPKECKEAGDTSGIACMMVLARHMNNGIADYREAIPNQEGPGSLRLWEEKLNPLLRLSWKAVPLQKSEQYEMLKKEMVQVDGNYKNQYSFEFWNNSDLMRKTLWDRPKYRLFGSMIAKNDDAEWDAAESLRSQVIEIDNAKTGQNGFDVAAAITESCGSFALEGTETGERLDFAWCPEILRVRYTPSAFDDMHLDALHSFNVELPCDVDVPEKQEYQQYNLTAAVRLRGAGIYEEDKRDRIRLFAASGYDIYPEAPSPYADMKWDIVEYGHTYCLYYSRTRAHRMPPLTDLERENRDACDERRRSAEYRKIFEIVSRKEEGDGIICVYDMINPELRKNYPQERRVIDMSGFRPWPRSRRRAPVAVAYAPLEINEEDVETKDSSAPASPVPAVSQNLSQLS
ncbi:X-Pro dipeptidyl-peptidase [Colletotrichum asianum]